MLRSGFKQKGFALLTVLMISVIVIITTGIVLLRVTNMSRELVRRERLDKSLTISDAVISNTIDWLNYQGYDDSRSDPLLRPRNQTSDSLDYIKDFYDTSKTSTSSTGYSLMTTTTTIPTTTISNSEKATGLIVDSSTAVWDPSVTSSLKDLYINGKINYVNNTFLNDLMTQSSHTNLVLGTTPITTASGTITSTTSVTAINGYPINNTDPLSTDPASMGPNILAEKIYHKYILKDPENPGVTSEVRIGLIPLATNISNLSENQLHGKGISGTGIPDPAKVVSHDDVYKLRATICVPQCYTDESQIIQKRKLELIVVRPVRTNVNIKFDEAIYARGNVSFNGTTSSGPVFTTTISDPVIGDIYSETNVDIASGGIVGGKVTAVGVASIRGDAIPDTGGIPSGNDPRCATMASLCSHASQVLNQADSASHVPKRPSPIPASLGTMPTVSCDSTAGWDSDPRIIKDCKIDASLSLDHTPTQFQGTVYITGDLTMKGGDSFAATGTSPVHIIVDGQIDIQGDTVGTSTISPVFISNFNQGPPADAIKIAGNPSTGVDHGAVFMTTNPVSNVKLGGSSEVFGAIVSNGTVNSVGSSMQMRRDTNLDDTGLPNPPTKGECAMKIVSWKELSK